MISRRVLIWIGCVGLALRLVIALASNGSNDFFIWHTHAILLEDHGFSWAYANTGSGTDYQLYNHPPLPGLYAMLCRRLSGDDTHIFGVLFKIPCLVSEVFAALLLERIWRRRKDARAGAIAFAAYGLALAPIAVSAYHCNTDAICATLALLACERSERGKHGAAGLALAGALSVKVIGILLVPLLFFRARSPRKKALFSACLTTTLIPYVPLAMHLGVIAKAILGYSPRLEHWGFPYLFETLARWMPAAAPGWTTARELAIHSGKFLVAASSAGIGLLTWKKPSLSAYAGGSFALLGFLAFTPGFGVQYVVAVAPLLFAFDLKVGATYATLSGIFVTAVYLSFLVPGRVPYVSMFDNFYSTETSMIGLAAWIYCLAQMPRTLRAALAEEGATS